MNLAIATAASGHDVLTQAAKAGIIVVVLCVGLRLLGKRQMGELNLYDLAMLMAAANAVQNAMTAGRGDLSVGIATATTVVGVGWLATKVLRLRPRLAVRALGSPTVLVRDGQILQARVRRQRITTAELDASARVHGLRSARDAALIVLEVDGTLNVVPPDEI